jgi:hypothetical protein
MSAAKRKPRPRGIGQERAIRPAKPPKVGGKKNRNNRSPPPAPMVLPHDCFIRLSDDSCIAVTLMYVDSEAGDRNFHHAGTGTTVTAHAFFRVRFKSNRVAYYPNSTKLYAALRGITTGKGWAQVFDALPAPGSVRGGKQRYYNLLEYVRGPGFRNR